MESKNGLLPPEFAARYRQQFVDHLWIRGLIVTIGLYMAGLAVYFVAVNILSIRTGREERVANGISGQYTNSVGLQVKYKVLKQRQDLKYAALDCWRVVALHMPDSLTLDTLTFGNGERLNLTGIATSGHEKDVLDFSENLRKATVDGQPFFNPLGSDPPVMRTTGNGISWSLGFELKRTEAR